MIKKVKEISINIYIVRFNMIEFRYDSIEGLYIDDEWVKLTKQENDLINWLCLYKGKITVQNAIYILNTDSKTIRVVCKNIEKKVGFQVFKKYTHGRIEFNESE